MECVIPSQRERAAFFAAACQHVVEAIQQTVETPQEILETSQQAVETPQEILETSQHTEQPSQQPKQPSQHTTENNEEWTRRFCDLLALHSYVLGSPVIE